jgi:cellulose synthase/poly-beta-1,6-N-acetylglucosamine synthase-like glycosyltransferase
MNAALLTDIGAAAILLLLAAGTVLLALGNRRVPTLAALPPWEPTQHAPRVSIIVPARNEARGIGAAIATMLALDYPDFEVIVIDDRSTDGTAQALEAVPDPCRRLRRLGVTELPADWLGKNHANAVGAAAATGEWLLFTDADIHFESLALGRAMRCATEGHWDHLTAAPHARLPGAVLSQFALYFGLLFSLFARPWAARNPRSRAHVGIGAFNLVRRSAYEAIGGHAALRLRPDDDLKLGKLLKQAGYRQLFLNGCGAIEVEWYSTWREVRDGLMKNLFAGSGYSVPLTVFGGLLQLAVLTGPPLGVIFASGVAQWCSALACGLLLLQGWASAPSLGTRRWAGALLPLFGVFGTWLMWRSMYLALSRGYIEWRGTRYPLAELRRQKI